MPRYSRTRGPSKPRSTASRARAGCSLPNDSARLRSIPPCRASALSLTLASVVGQSALPWGGDIILLESQSQASTRGPCADGVLVSSGLGVS